MATVKIVSFLANKSASTNTNVQNILKLLISIHIFLKYLFKY